MRSNLALLLGPVLGLVIARLFGPWRPLTALAAAVIGQVLVFGGYALRHRYRINRLMTEPLASGVLLARVEPTLRRRFTVFAVLFAIAAAATAACLAIQFVASSGSFGPTSR